MEKFINILTNLFKNNKISDVSHSNKTSKTILSATEHLTINAQTNENIKKIQDDIKKILKTLEYNPIKIIEFIKNTNTKVYNIKNANNILKLINEEEGFITELKGFKGLFINLITEKIFCTTSKPIFIISDNNLEPAILLHHFYKWYALQMDLPGFDFQTQENFKKHLKRNYDTSKLSINEIIDMQEAIARDKEATQLALNYIQETKGAKQVRDKMIDGGANI